MDIDIVKMDFLKKKYIFKKHVWTQAYGPSNITQSFEPITTPYGVVIRTVHESGSGRRRIMEILPESIMEAPSGNNDGVKLIETLSSYDSVKEVSVNMVNNIDWEKTDNEKALPLKVVVSGYKKETIFRFRYEKCQCEKDCIDERIFYNGVRVISSPERKAPVICFWPWHQLRDVRGEKYTVRRMPG